MNLLRAALLAAWALLAANALAATTTTVVDIAAPSGGTQRFLYVRPDAPVANIVSLPGGDGLIGIQNDFTMPTTVGRCSPVGRNRQAFADRGFAVALVDATSAGSVRNYDDVREVVRHMRARDNVPTWVIGGSAATEATVDLAINLPSEGPVGAIFWAPVAFSASQVGLIKQPTLVVYHGLDVLQAGAAFFTALTAAPVRERVVLAGGSNADCGFHLFNGIDAAFVSATAGFIDKYNGTLQSGAPNLQGLWWGGQSQSGWGVNLAHQGDVLFATWFTYDLDGSGLWLSSDAHKVGANYVGQLYQSRGAPFLAYDGSQFRATPVGTATFAFANANSGTFTYTVNGATQSKSLTRYLYASPAPTCTLGGTAGSGAPNYEDLWWRSPAGSENGWGVNISHQGDILFATWFTYGPDGSDMWMVMSAGGKVSDRTYTGEIHRTTSAPFNAYDTTRYAATLVGSGTFTFSDANNGTFSYTVDGVAQSKPITRFAFSSPRTTCRF